MKTFEVYLGPKDAIWVEADYWAVADGMVSFKKDAEAEGSYSTIARFVLSNICGWAERTEGEGRP